VPRLIEAVREWWRRTDFRQLLACGLSACENLRWDDDQSSLVWGGRGVRNGGAVCLGGGGAWFAAFRAHVAAIEGYVVHGDHI